ncbi:dihydropteroate synthase [Agaribacter marinus]|uniref:Dihydropteroate synthase n=2 Tax=Agaribacter marinus TaxID=1431249 RepID=A0AA37SZ06_9ALTE|nr:dihydropteroate synthase [Agaribacter marinus]
MMEFGNKTVVFDGPKVMGILNVTPDSFSDGGKYKDVNKAIDQAAEMVKKGATFVDIGGESTRPGATEVLVDEELNRVIPVIEAIHARFDTIISIDTSKPQVMLEATAVGARLINDVRALRLDGALDVATKLAKEKNIPSCIMHMQGSPLTMQNNPKYDSVVDEVLAFFRERIDTLVDAGFKYKQIMIDPGFGFGKNLEDNYQLLKHFLQFTEFDLPVLAGMSRKRMIGNLLNKDVENRLTGDISTHTIAALYGASVLRVHDVEAIVDVVKIIDKINSVS